MKNLDEDTMLPSNMVTITSNQESLTLSNIYLQRKFKINASMSDLIIAILKELKFGNTWKVPRDEMPDKDIVVISYSKGLIDEGYDFHLAKIDCCRGWINKDTNQPLVVIKWMYIPKHAENIEENTSIGKNTPKK